MKTFVGKPYTSLRERLHTAFATSGFSVLPFCFHLGYQGVVLPPWLRRIIARSELHEAWLSGFTGAGLCKVTERRAAAKGDKPFC
jgi:hypothetical protein